MSEFSRSQFPPGGWEFFNPSTGWSAPTPKGSTFDQTVNLIIKHRLANPAATVKHRLSTDIATVGNELENYTRARIGLPAMGSELPKMTPPATLPSMSGAVLGAVAAVKKMAAGVGFLLEWEESGLPPVGEDVSEKRAGICVDCPKNEQGKSLTEIFTVPAAAMIQRKYERLEQMQLKTSHDVNLKVCQACLCPLRLKVHAPMELILKRLKPEQRAELDTRCWILSAS
jgi:hypothetical protein